MISRQSIEVLTRLRGRFARLYGEDCADGCLRRLAMMVGRYGVGDFAPAEPRAWDASDCMLITYADSIRQEGRKNLSVLHHVLKERLRDTIKMVHILPFFPYSSDDGFAVIDFRSVNPEHGDWEHVEKIGRDFGLMFDLVLNHVSAESEWMNDYIAGIAPARDYFIEVDPGADCSGVVRPRSTPLLRTTPTRHGEKHLWTTFSADQIDLDFANPDVLFEFLDILMGYIAHGARVIRLDAIAYLWKRQGTPCIHLEETHEVVKLLRDFMDMVEPSVTMLTETNVPHEENISYFGSGDEAHMVYQFSLPPLVLHALVAGDASWLTAWAKALTPPPPGCAYFNFTASHDGIGVRPLRGLLPEGEMTALIEHVRERGGAVSTKTDADGSESPYELNISYFDALGDGPDGVSDTHIRRFLCSQTIAMELQGIPGVYIHSLLGTRNDLEGVRQTGRARSINRTRWDWPALREHLRDKHSHHAKIFSEYRRRLHLRARQTAFHPAAEQEVLDLGPALFAVRRVNPDTGQSILCVSNVTGDTVTADMKDQTNGASAKNLLTGSDIKWEKPVKIAAYKTLWLETG